MRAVDLSIVTYAPDIGLLQQLLESLAEPAGDDVRRNLFIQDNSSDAAIVERMRGLPQLRDGLFDHVDVQRSESNVGFGRGHNANAARGTAPWLLVVNQDCILEPGVLGRLLDAAAGGAADDAAWELRQIPYEHPKEYDPVTLETSWVSGAATLFRRAAYEQVAGFEPRIFMYGEDVDLSWRLRARGWRLIYQPQLGVVHRTYKHPHESKPLQVHGGVLTNLCLRARFGGVLRTFQGLTMLAAEIVARNPMPGRRRGLAMAGLAFLACWPYFALSPVRPTARFRPLFAGWGYESRRDGAFVPFASLRDKPPRARPLVSILIRTFDRAQGLREALQSCAHQTYPNIEVVVVEDGPERSRAVVEEFAGRLAIRYSASGERIGRARAGNLALAQARGEWLNFLDDDDLLFADHVEALVDAVQASGLPGAHALAWETRIAQRREVAHFTRYHQRFDRLTLWHHNYLPIQAVLFHRRLYERHGGFAEDMDRLEDWNLWTRYTLADDFAFVEKTTSKYRVPGEAHLAAHRQELLDLAYAEALARQEAMSVTFSPRDIARMADTYARSQTVVMVTRNDLRRFVGGYRVIARIASYRPVAGRVLRRLGWLK